MVGCVGSASYCQSQLTLTALNLSQSAYLCFTFAANRFFSRYSFEGSQQHRDRFFCVLYLRVCSMHSPAVLLSHHPF